VHDLIAEAVLMGHDDLQEGSGITLSHITLRRPVSVNNLSGNYI